MKRNIDWGLGLIPTSAFASLSTLADQLFDSVFDSKWYKTDFPSDVVHNKDENENLKSVSVKVALAGVPKEQIKVSVDNQVLSISVEKQSKEEKSNEVVYNGVSKKSFLTKYVLSDKLNSDNITASYVDGLLTVDVPAKPVPENKQLEIPIN